MLKHLLTFAFILLVSKQIYAQSDNFFSLYQYNTNIINPAYTGSHESLDIGIMYNWNTVHLFDFDSPDSASRSFLANIHSPIGDNLGAGFSYESGEIGPLKEKDLELGLSYKFALKKNSTLSLGVNGGLTFINLKLINSGLLNDGDDALFYENVNQKLKNVGFGMYYHTAKFYTGISYAYYFGDSFISSNDMILNSYSKFSLINGFAGYVFDISDKIKLKPSMMAFFNSANNETWFYLSGNLYLNDTLEIGISYNLSKAFAFTIISPSIAKTFKLGLRVDFLENYQLQDQSYQNLTLFTTFNINAFKKEISKTYF